MTRTSKHYPLAVGRFPLVSLAIKLRVRLCLISMSACPYFVCAKLATRGHPAMLLSKRMGKAGTERSKKDPSSLAISEYMGRHASVCVLS